MKPIDLDADALGAAIRARAAEPLKPVWIHVVIPGGESQRAINRWCILRAADHQPGLDRERRITTLCSFDLPYTLVSVTTHRPHNTCPACETELAAGTPGAAVAVELADPHHLHGLDAPALPSRPTINIRGPRPEVDPVAAWYSWYAASNLGAPPQGSDHEIAREHALGDVGGAFDSLNDLRIPEEP